MILTGFKYTASNTTSGTGKDTLRITWELRIQGIPVEDNSDDAEHFRIVMRLVDLVVPASRKPIIGVKKLGAQKNDGRLFDSEKRNETVLSERILDAGPLTHQECLTKLNGDYGLKGLASPAMVAHAKEVFKNHPNTLSAYLQKVKPPQQVISALVRNDRNQVLFVTGDDGKLSLPVAVLAKGDNREVKLEGAFTEAAGFKPQRIRHAEKPVFIPDLEQLFHAAVGYPPAWEDLSNKGKNTWLDPEKLSDRSLFDPATQYYVPIFQL